MSYYGGDPGTLDTEKFVRHMDKFFDCLNVRCLSDVYQSGLTRKTRQETIHFFPRERFKVD